MMLLNALLVVGAVVGASAGKVCKGGQYYVRPPCSRPPKKKGLPS